MFDKGIFLAWWTPANLGRIGMSHLSIDPAEVNTEADKKSTYYVFCNGLMLGNTRAHLTITPDSNNNEFTYFHFTLDAPDCQHVGKGKEYVRCDHVFFEVLDETGDIAVTTKLITREGKNGTADSKKGLSHNASFLSQKVKADLEKLMSYFSADRVPSAWH
jgi:hypothetical protein